MAATCSNCRTLFDVHLSTCPNCGSEDRDVAVTEVFKLDEFLRIKGTTPNPNGEKPLNEFTQKTKLSGETKREALDKISKVRTQEETMVWHEVWGKDDEGKWKKVHDHYKNNK